MKDELRKLGGMRHLLRPEGVSTPEEFNAHLDTIVRCVNTLRMEIEPEPEPVPQSREELGGRDRKERGGRKRKGSALTNDTFGQQGADTSSHEGGE